MAEIKIYVPCFMAASEGGKRAYYMAELTGQISDQRVREGQVMISSRVIHSTPSPDLQPLPESAADIRPDGLGNGDIVPPFVASGP